MLLELVQALKGVEELEISLLELLLFAPYGILKEVLFLHPG